MKTYWARKGAFGERPYYAVDEIEAICLEALKAVGLYPAEPMPIRIDRFIEKRFRVHPAYEEMPEGVLGYTRFGQNGVEEIVIAQSLAEERTETAERRITTTLAHEGGHGLLHAHLFALGGSARTLFGDPEAPDSPKILCRGEIVPEPGPRRKHRYDGRWWEFQANRAMAALLLPRPLVERSLDLVARGAFGTRVLDDARRNEAARHVAEIFGVNPIVARLRVDEVHPAGSGQLTL